MPAFADYLDLRLAVSEHVGNRSISDVFPRLVQAAEASLNTKLRHRKQLTDATATFTNGIAALPADYLEMASFYDPQGRVMCQVPPSGVKFSGSQYSSYAIDGTNILIYGLAGDRSFTYYAKLPTLTTSPTTSNWLLETYPDVYLYAVGFEAAKFLRDEGLATATAALLGNAMSELTVDDGKARWGGSVVRVASFCP